MNTGINKSIKYVYSSVVLCLLLYSTSCINDLLPDVQEAFDRETNYTQQLYRPVLGRTTLFSNNFQSGNSTLPLTFEITRIVKADGSPAPELTDIFPVSVWKEPYSGDEKSIEEIEAKRVIEYRPVFEVKKHSGEFVMWANAMSSFVNCYPTKGYFFDVKVENKGGYRFFNNLQLLPYRESDYEPSIYDQETGLITDKDYILPTVVRSVYLETGRYALASQVHVYLFENRDNTDETKSLTFRFYEPDYTPIPPENFNLTKWDDLIHGFNREMGPDYVKYDVLYPLPLIQVPTEFTNEQGNMVRVRFEYDRITSRGYRQDSLFELEFAIYKEAHWEVVVVFAEGAPEFRDHV